MSARDALSARATRAALLVAGASPWVMPFVGRWLPRSIASAVDFLFASTCHRIPSRTLELAGAPMPLCSRCAGIFAGLALGAIAARPHLELRRARIWLAGAAALMVADVVAQDTGLHPMWHATRLATGVVLGYVVAVALVSLARPDASGAASRAPS